MKEQVLEYQPADQYIGPINSNNVFDQLEKKVYAALETYSNVHRGTGQFSTVSTALYERARDIVLTYLSLSAKQYTVLFTSALAYEMIRKQLDEKHIKKVSSEEIGLPLGIMALAVKKQNLPKGRPFLTGGSVARMVSKGYVVWAGSPQKFEAGTPAVINGIALAVALLIVKDKGKNCFRNVKESQGSVSEVLQKDDLSGYAGLKLLSALNERLIGKNISVPVAEGKQHYINLDNAASTPTYAPVWETVCKTWRLHERNFQPIVSEAEKIIQRFLKAEPDKYHMLFTGNTTEAINLLSRSLQPEKDKYDVVVVNTLLEHNSNELPWRFIPGVRKIRLDVDKEGFISAAELEIVLKRYNEQKLFGKQRIRLVAVSGASNVLGTVNDIELLARTAHKYGARILVDGAQLVAHRRVDLEKWDVDYLVFSGHKVYAPFGTGVLIYRKGQLGIEPEDLARLKACGEENVAGIAALAKAISLLERTGMQVIEDNERILTSRLLNGLKNIQGIDIYGVTDTDSEHYLQKTGIVSFGCLKKMGHHTVARELAWQGGIGIRFGCFCTHLLIKKQLGLPGILEVVQNAMLTLFPGISNMIPGMIRVSLGLHNSAIDIDKLVIVLERILQGQVAGRQSGISEQEIGKFCQIRVNKVY